MKSVSPGMSREWLLVSLILVPVSCACLASFFARDLLAGQVSRNVVRGLNSTMRIIMEDQTTDPPGLIVEELIDQLGAASCTDRLNVIAQLGQGSSSYWSQQAVPVLIKIIEYGTNDLERQGAALAMVSLSGMAKDGIPAMLSFLGDRQGEIRGLAAVFLVKFGRVVEKPLQEALNSTDDRRFAAAALALSDYQGNRLQSSTERLQSLAQHQDPTIRVHVAHALGRTGVRAVEKQLMQLLHDTDPLVRAEAVESLGLLDYQPKELLAILQPMFQDKVAAVRQQVIKTIGLGDADDSIFNLIKEHASRETDEDTRVVTIRAMERLSWRKLSADRYR